MYERPSVAGCAFYHATCLGNPKQVVLFLTEEQGIDLQLRSTAEISYAAITRIREPVSYYVGPNPPKLRKADLAAELVLWHNTTTGESLTYDPVANQAVRWNISRTPRLLLSQHTQFQKQLLTESELKYYISDKEISLLLGRDLASEVEDFDMLLERLKNL